MMDAYRFEVFATSTQLRWFDQVGTMRDRSLDRAEITMFAEDVDNRYRAQAPGADLAELGRELYRWLDGPTERWLAQARDRLRSMVVHIDVHDRLRQLPWELMHDGAGYLAVHPARPICPVRLVSKREGDGRVPANRPLRILFMASSPDGVIPALDYEHEESLILRAGGDLVDLVVEESGSLEGLASVVKHEGNGYFDVLHLSGHAMLGLDGPRFLLETDTGELDAVSADQIADAINGRWPSLVFLSGCQTGSSADGGAFASMAESLVDAGAPAVLGWALPVGDLAASQLAATLYGELAVGASLDHAVTTARRALEAANSRYWHLLRLYTDRSKLAPFVTPPGAIHRELLRRREPTIEFLDRESKIPVAGFDSYVGRRRVLQSCLKALRNKEAGSSVQLLLLHGMGGLGKSTLAARVLLRMRALYTVVVGRLDEAVIINRMQDLSSDLTTISAINQTFATPGLTLEQRLRSLFDGALASTPCVFVFDDFEVNLEPDGRGYVCSAEALEVVRAVCGAIASTASPSRVLITSRYNFPLPDSIRRHLQPFIALQGADLDKKLRNTANLRPGSPTPPALRDHAIAAAAGIPRLIEWLDKVLGDDQTDHHRVVAAIDGRQEEFRESILAQTLLDAQAPETRRFLALAAIYEIPVPTVALSAISPNTPIDTALRRSVAVGLIDVVRNVAANEDRYLVSSLLKPLLTKVDEALSEADRATSVALGARALYARWVVVPMPSEAELLEVFRLGELARDEEIVRVVGDGLADWWIHSARFREVDALTRRSLEVQDGPGVLLYAGWSRSVLGLPLKAINMYSRRLVHMRTSGERAGEAATLSNIGVVYNGLGQSEIALEYFNQALLILRDLDDHAAEATTLNNIGQAHAGLGYRNQALGYFNQALATVRDLGDRAGEAVILNNIALCYNKLGLRDDALGYYNRALSIFRDLRDRSGETIALGNIGSVLNDIGQRYKALDYYNKALPIRRDIGDRTGEAATLNNIASFITSSDNQTKPSTTTTKRSPSNETSATAQAKPQPSTTSAPSITSSDNQTKPSTTTTKHSPSNETSATAQAKP